jgi:gluconate 2-dehydrogenase gamma chain
LEATDALARRTQNAAFVDLTPDKQDALLTSIDNGAADGFPNARAFFNRARRLALEGMFGDPYYGGNKNFAGWDLIKYPGPRMATTAADQRMGVEISPYHHSAYGGAGPSGENHGH